jgi:hypothetical protein
MLSEKKPEEEPQEIASKNLQEIYQGLADKTFWIALADIHSITKGKLEDYDCSEKIELGT